MSLELSFDQHRGKLSNLVVLGQVVGQFLGVHLDIAKSLASHKLWVERVVTRDPSWCMICNSFGNGLFSFHVCETDVSRDAVKISLSLRICIQVRLVRAM